MMGSITIVGLGPGHPGLLTMEVWELLKNAGQLIIRTGKHPTVAAVVEHERLGCAVALVAPVVEEVLPEALLVGGFQEAGRNDLVGVDVFKRQGNARAYEGGKFLFHE